MTRSSIKHARILGLLLVLWLVFTMVAASPAWADHDQGQGDGHSDDGDDDDDDDHDGGDDDDSKTTTTFAISATTVPAPITTIPPTTTTMPVRAPTTTTATTLPATTTTIAPPRSDQWEEERLEDSWGPTTRSSSDPGPPDDFDSNLTLVLSMAVAANGGSDESSIQSDDNRLHISPREGLTVAFSTAVEALEDQLLQSMLIGILVAAFIMAGVDKRRIEPQIAPAPSRSYAHHRDHTI